MTRHFLEPLLEFEAASQRLVNERTGEVVADDVELAADSKSRNRGLLGRTGLAQGSVLIIAPGNAIHTFFMRFTIDVVFADRTGRVLKVSRQVRPWRMRMALRAFAVLELAGGTVGTAQIIKGDRLFLGRKPGFDQ